MVITPTVDVPIFVPYQAPSIFGIHIVRNDHQGVIATSYHAGLKPYGHIGEIRTSAARGVDGVMADVQSPEGADRLVVVLGRGHGNHEAVGRSCLLAHEEKCPAPDNAEQDSGKDHW
jgi:hypothetical protein